MSTKPLPPSKRAYNGFIAANYFNNKGKYAEAIRRYHKVLEISPRHWAAMTNLGDALADTGRTAEALRWYDKAIELKPTHAKAWQGRSSACLEAKKWKEAHEASLEAVRLKPRDWEMWSNAALALREMDRLDEAIRAMKKAAEVGCRAEPIYQLGLLYLENDDVQGARRQLDGLLTIGDDERYLLFAAISKYLEAHPEPDRPSTKRRRG